MTGIKSTRAMFHTAQVNEEHRAGVRVDKIRALQLLDIDKLEETFGGMHKDFEQQVTADCAKNINWNIQKPQLVTPNFLVGDCVFVRRARDKGHKQSFRWMEPRPIVQVVGKVVYDVQNILSKKIERVHAARMILYRSDKDGKAVSAKLLPHAEHSERKYELVDELLDISGNDKSGIFIQVKWVGLPEKSDWTWQSLQALYEDVRDEVEQLLETTRKN